jgi:hypothetical protein
MRYLRVWKNPVYATITIVCCVVSAIAALTQMAAVVLSGATDVVTGLWCLIISALAAGLYDPLENEPIINRDKTIDQARLAAQVALCFPPLESTAGDIALQDWVYNAMLFPGEMVRFDVKDKPMLLPTLTNKIDMHHAMRSFVVNDKAWKRICAIDTQESNGMWLEIADYMYTSILSCVRHDVSCRNKPQRVSWPGVCSNDVGGISSMALAVAHHAHCDGVSQNNWQWQKYEKEFVTQIHL